MKHCLSWIASLLLILASAQAQQLTITGSLLDDSTRTPLVGANVLLISTADSTVRVGNKTTKSGTFSVEDVKPGTYRIHASYLGYTTLQKVVELRAGRERLGTLTLKQDAVNMKEVVVEARMPPMEQKGDTVQYNAQSYKVNPDATTEDLVAKLPGVTVTNGQVTHAGEQVKKTYKDGRPFFGDDPAQALKNLPAEAVSSIQFFDDKSDQSKLTGFDDGQTEKAINIITRVSRRKGQFGRLYAGGGTEKRYSGGGNMNFYSDTAQVSLIGMTNNVNQQNFTVQDLLGSAGIAPRGGLIGMGMRMFGVGRGGAVDNMIVNMASRGGNSFLVGQQSGLNITNSIGGNYNDQWGSALKLSGSYFFSTIRNTNNQATDRQYFLQNGGTQYYNELADASSRSANHRLNARLEFTPDTMNTVYFTPRFSFQNTTSGSLTNAGTTINAVTLSSSNSNSSATADGWTGNANVSWRRRFNTPGRSIVLSLNASGNDRTGTSYIDALNRYYSTTPAIFDTTNQMTATASKGHGFGGNLTYTELVVKDVLMQASYDGSYSKSSSDKRAWEYDYALQNYGILAPGLSNVLDNGYITHRAGLGLRLRGDSLNAMLQINAQRASLSGDQTYPAVLNIDRSFTDFLPSANLDWRISRSTNLHAQYRTSTTPPSVTQLQDVVDNSNVLLLSTGNRNLRQDYAHNLSLRYGRTNMQTMSGFFVFLSGGITRNYIGTSTIIASADTTLANGIALQRGAQLSLPVNLNGYGNARSFLTWSQPVDFIKSNLSLTGGVNYARTPGLTNGVETKSDNYNILGGMIIASNISENFDFTISYNATQNLIRNSFNEKQNYNYFSHAASVRLNWIFLKSIVLRGDVTHQYTHGLGSGNDQDFLMLNGGIGYKFLSDQTLELSLNAFDILDRNKSTTRTITESYLEDVRPTVLGRYVLLTLTWTLKNFSGNEDMRPPFMGPPPGERRGDRGPGGDGPPPGGPGGM